MMITMFYVSHIDPILNFVTAQVYTNYTGYNNLREILDLVVAVVVVVVVVVVIVVVINKLEFLIVIINISWHYSYHQQLQINNFDDK